MIPVLPRAGVKAPAKELSRQLLRCEGGMAGGVVEHSASYPAFPTLGAQATGYIIKILSAYWSDYIMQNDHMEYMIRNAIMSQTNVHLGHSLLQMGQEEIHFGNACEHVDCTLQSTSYLCSHICIMVIRGFLAV